MLYVESNRGRIFNNYKNKEYIQYDKNEDMISFKSSKKRKFF